MSSLAKWLIGQRAYRVAFMAGMFPLPGLGILSAALLIMIAQLRGPRDALLDTLLAIALLAVVAQIAGMDALPLAATAAFSWFAWLGLGSLLGRTGSLRLVLQVAVVLAVLALAVIPLLLGDLTAFWTAELERLYQDLAKQGVEIKVDMAAQAQLMTGVAVALFLGGSMLAVLLGNSWASAFSGGDFAVQFRELRLGLIVGILAALTGLAELLGLQTGGALLVFGVAFAFHGFAVLVWWANELAWPRSWWVGLCILLLLVPNLLIVAMLLICAVGFVDNWYNLRRKTA